MKIGIIGLPQVGKKTLFEILTNRKPTEHDIASKESIKAVANIQDSRLEVLANAYKPNKTTGARIDIEMLPKLEKDVIAKGEIFQDISGVDAICHVVRAFQDESIYHIEGSVDPKRDVDSINLELIVRDLLFIEKRMENIEKSIKRSGEEAVLKEKQLLAKLKVHLEKELPLRLLELSAQEENFIINYSFLTRKSMIIILNVSENDINNNQLWKNIKEDCQLTGAYVMQVCAKIEAEIAKFESGEERKEFLDELGIKESATNMLAQVCIKALNLISFFTVGSDEVRQWTVISGAMAPKAAGVIHSDLEKGFIRAEVIKYDDFINLGSEAKLKEAGKLYLKGKDYIVEDGDILNIRFNV